MSSLAETLPTPLPSVQADVCRSCLLESSVKEVPAMLEGQGLLLRCPLGLAPDDLGLQGISTASLVSLLGGGVMTLVNAIMAEKRVLFFGRTHGPGGLCRFVLAAVLLVSPPLTGILDTRCFPYVSLGELSWQAVPGYIAGTSNPLFESKPDLWDVYCDLDQAKVTVRPPALASLLSHPSHNGYDKALLRRVQDSLSSGKAAGDD
eukprot:RCo034566